MDTSILIDVLRQFEPAVELFEQLAAEDANFVSSYVVRAEVLAGMRPNEERATRRLLATIEWLPVTEPEAEAAGALGRRVLRANPGVEVADLLLAEIAERQGATLLTTNIKHFRELFPRIRPPYAS